MPYFVQDSDIQIQQFISHNKLALLLTCCLVYEHVILKSSLQKCIYVNLKILVISIAFHGVAVMSENKDLIFITAVLRKII